MSPKFENCIPPIGSLLERKYKFLFIVFFFFLPPFIFRFSIKSVSLITIINKQQQQNTLKFSSKRFYLRCDVYALLINSVFHNGTFAFYWANHIFAILCAFPFFLFISFHSISFFSPYFFPIKNFRSLVFFYFCFCVHHS